MTTLKFTVDAKLLRELGERLVGRPHIALGELIKNAYDADARHVEIRFDGATISISDDGHGMSEKAFTRRWMRIGTTHKARERTSPGLGRVLTGSKGVGRLSVQLLASRLDLRSTPLADQRKILSPNPPIGAEIKASIDWRSAVEHDQLTDVPVEFELPRDAQTTYASGARHGTKIVLSGLNSVWDAQSFEYLAREIWALQPPFAVDEKDSSSFEIKLIAPSPEIQRTFDEQMTAIMDVANATIVGRLLEPGDQGPQSASRFILPVATKTEDEDGELNDTSSETTPEQVASASALGSRYALITVEMSGRTRERFVVEVQDCKLDNFDFEVRVFDLRRRQPFGITVDVAREYLAQFGGVHIYDNGFRLPYYGPDTDWLRLELDHARRISRSQLVPEELQIRNAMLDLPSNKRVFGVANISTSREQQRASEMGRSGSDALSIQITRDRLTDNLAFEQLRRTVRLSLDLYALARAKSKVIRAIEVDRPVRESPVQVIRAASDTVEAIRTELRPESYLTLRDAVDTLAADVELRTRETRAYASLLGSLATAGMTSLAYEHEVSAQRGEVVEVARQMRLLASRSTGESADALTKLANRLSQWEQRSDRIRALFRPLLDEESRTTTGIYSASKLAADVVESLKVLARATKVDTSEIPRDLKLPNGTYTAWSAVLQNLLVNAFRATLEKKPALVKIDGGTSERSAWLRVQDNGAGGVDLSKSHRLFLPFERGAAISERAEILGLGGSGLGLTIVRMITDEIGATVRFVAPEDGWSTALRIEWRSK
ncbi:ATP-binding protein [Microbacterium sp. T32]|uniref:ATP-binding protein n=1 Tax=Microbacterium sp. T32 TaxID=1776083 RepID=UPI0009ED39D5|nr:ATP-binding protein [Microbacterium sp. T32]